MASGRSSPLSRVAGAALHIHEVPGVLRLQFRFADCCRIDRTASFIVSACAVTTPVSVRQRTLQRTRQIHHSRYPTHSTSDPRHSIASTQTSNGQFVMRSTSATSAKATRFVASGQEPMHLFDVIKGHVPHFDADDR